MSIPNQTWRDSSGSGFPLMLGELSIPDVPLTIISTDTTQVIGGVRVISVGASLSNTVAIGGGVGAFKLSGTSGLRLLIPMADLGYTPDMKGSPIALVCHFTNGVGNCDTAGVVGFTSGFDTDSTNPFNTANWHGNTDTGRWFMANNFGGSGRNADVAGFPGAPFPPLLSASNRVYSSVLYTHGFNSNCKITPPSAADPGIPQNPWDPIFEGPYSNNFRQVDTDTLFTQGTDPDRPFVILNFAGITQDGGQPPPILDYVSLWVLEPS